VGDCCRMPTRQFIFGWWWGPLCTRPTHLVDFYSKEVIFGDFQNFSILFIIWKMMNWDTSSDKLALNTVKSVYNIGHSREPENVGIMSSYPLYTG
jgi:hypothetical protein